MKKKSKKVVMISGGFDPVHVGHLDMFKEAKELGDELVVVVNNDNWKRAKRRYVFMPEQDRKEIIEAFSFVDKVILTEHKNPKTPKDMSVIKELAKIKPHIFANGGDRNEDDAKNPDSSLFYEVELCDKLGIEMVFNIGKRGKIRSSTDLVKEAVKNHINKK
ncbi:MAG: adenylyltransferase/cytidyltransferase family protein [Candidatus Paceibacterota bacterium]